MSFVVRPGFWHIGLGLVSLLVGLPLLRVEGQPTTDEDAEVNFNLIVEVAKLRMELTKLKATVRSKHHSQVTQLKYYADYH